MEGLACTSCDQSTPKGGLTVVGSRRIVIRQKGGFEQVVSAEAISQTCPSCAERAIFGALTIKCYLPPLLEVEYTTTMNYIRRTFNRNEFLEQCRLPEGCSSCRIPLIAGKPFVELSIGTEWYIWRPRQRRSHILRSGPARSAPLGTNFRSDLRWEKLVECANRLVFAKICSSCSNRIWDVDMQAGYFRGGERV